MTKRAVVTGASEGIGRAFAVALAKDGWRITAVARNEERLKELVRELGGGHDHVVADLSTPGGVARARDALLREHTDLLVNNAGFGVWGPFHTLELERLQAMTRLNVDALVALAHAFLGQAKRGDALINVSSTLAFMPLPSLGLYSATKSLVTAFSESLWYENRRRGVYVMGLCPGITKTNFHARSGGDPSQLPPEHMAQTSEQVVAVALAALKERKKPTVISGGKNNMGAFFSRIVPRKTMVALMGKASKA